MVGICFVFISSFFKKIRKGLKLQTDSAVSSGDQGKPTYFMQFPRNPAWGRTVYFNVLFLIYLC